MIRLGLAVDSGNGPELSSWGQAIACAAYIATLPILVVPLGMLGFALEPNYARVASMLSDGPHPIKRLVRRVLRSPLC